MNNNYNIKRLSAYAFLISASLFILLLLTFFFASPRRELAENYMIYVVIALAVAGGVYYFLKAPVRKRRKAVTGPFPDEWRIILNEYVRFYTSLNKEGREKFEKQIQIFLAETRVTGVNTEIDDTDRVLAACSAVIPVFHFDDWEYTNVDEILLYPDLFDTRFETGGGRRIAGMVGSGAMNGIMILSRPALRQGFKNARDKKNVGIHEFIHLIDKMDGSIDGVPELLLEHQYSIPWLDMMRMEIEKINEGDSSDINPYGGTAPEEFFAVISEYFFERPKLLSKKHPRLYQMLNKIYKTDLKTFLKNAVRKKKEIGRNDPCPCGSGEKYKRCCGAPG